MHELRDFLFKSGLEMNVQKIEFGQRIAIVYRSKVILCGSKGGNKIQIDLNLIFRFFRLPACIS